MIELTELERDALTELLNIGVSRAAAALRTMVGKHVLLSVPSIEIGTPEEAARMLNQREADQLVAVRQDFTGAFFGRAMLIFPHANGFELVRSTLGADLPASELAAYEDEALSETGNILLNNCIGTIANMLERSFEVSAPEVLRGFGIDLITQNCPPGTDAIVLILYINFSVQNRDIRGYIALLMNMQSLATLKELVGEFIARVTSETGS